MTICFDIRALQIGHENRGIGMFIKSMIEHMPKDDNSYIFYAFDKNNPIETLGINFKNDYTLVQTPTVATAINSPLDIGNFVRLTWHRFSALRSAKINTFVQFDFQLGLPRKRKVKKVVIAYDLIPLIKRKEYIPGFRLAWRQAAGKKAKLKSLIRSPYYRLKYWLGYRIYSRADQVLAISRSTAEKFEELLKIPKSKLTTMHLAPVVTKDTSGIVPAGIGDKPFIFYIGGTDGRKRLVDIVRAFNIARGRGNDLDLVLAGNEFKSIRKLPDVEGRNAIMNSPYKESVHLVGFVSESSKIVLYKKAHAFIFCSAYEGFGLPIVEAMTSSCPVIAYNNSSIPEAAGDAAILIKTGDYTGVARAIGYLFDQPVRRKLIVKGLNQAAKFNWQDAVIIFMKVINA